MCYSVNSAVSQAVHLWRCQSAYLFPRQARCVHLHKMLWLISCQVCRCALWRSQNFLAFVSLHVSASPVQDETNKNVQGRLALSWV